MTIHVVQPGEDINTIANQYNLSPERLIRENELPNPNNLVVGQSLIILTPEVVHTVVEGDTLFEIAENYGVTPTKLLQNNPWISESEVLIPGTTVVIRFEQDEQLGDVVINGYAYPFIDRTVLRKTLPYLTYLSLFTYGFTPEGDLIPIEDDELIQLALEYGVAPIMMLAPMTPEGSFSNELAHSIFVNQEAQNKLINNIVTTMKAKNYYGIDIDFEYVLPGDKDLFIQFIQNIKNRLEPEGLLVFVALAPKTSGEQVGLLYQAHDYPAIGAIADLVLLMTYEWGYLYSSPMPTAPINNVRQVLDYGVSVIDREKILMGIPNYAYDWPLPYVKGETVATSLGNREAVALAAAHNATIEFDTTAQCPFFYYTSDEGIGHVVWFDDARSMNAKFRLIPEYKITGAGYWQIMKFFIQSWMIVISLFNVTKVVK